ncbi:MAG: SGNH/GDSL hydrolase family protein [Deltaproteobacteria bacterium]|nr:SGNH/GDSL hydrolase family protein [Deltaproteobacteria bacterium]
MILGRQYGRSLAKRLIFVTIAVVLAFVVIERLSRVGIRLYWDWNYESVSRVAENDKLRYDEKRGWSWDEEYQFRGRPDASVEKPVDTFRVITLGDSCTRGAGVQPWQTYSWKLELLLNETKPPLDVEVLNAGVYGYSSGQMADYLEVELLVYKPDVVTVYANPFDKSDQAVSPALIAERPRVESPKPSVGAPTPIIRWMQEQLFASRTYYLVRLLMGQGAHPGLTAKGPDDRRQSTNFLRIRSLCESIGAEMAIIEYVTKPLDNGRDILYVPETNETRPWEAEFVRIYPTMTAGQYVPDDLFNDAVHLTPLGHNIVARELADTFLRREWIAGEASARSISP